MREHAHPGFPLVCSAWTRFHRPELIAPDPLQVVREVQDPDEREMVAFLCASLALGRVKSIIDTCRTVLARLSPLTQTSMRGYDRIVHTLGSIRYRFFDEHDIAGLVYALGRTRALHGSLQQAFVAGLRPDHEDVHEALSSFVTGIASVPQAPKNLLLGRPERGSASKRLHLFLRWMVRHDEVDPGGWNKVSPSLLLYPIDTHMLYVSRALGLLSVRTPSLSASRSLTRTMRLLDPLDPVRFDFCLTRPGIHPMLDRDSWMQDRIDSAHA